MPDFLRGQCVQKDEFSYLEITVLADDTDPRADNIGGDFLDGWGLHLVDIHLTLPHILQLATQQVEKYVEKQR